MNYKEHYTSLLLMLSGALRSEFIGNEKLFEDLSQMKFCIEELEICKKALLLACEKISFGEGNYYDESESQEEAQDNYIYKKYTRPKELMEKFIKKAKETITIVK